MTFYRFIKIVWPNLQSENKFSFDTEGFYLTNPSVILPVQNKELLCILNSKLAWFFLKDICVLRSGGYIEMLKQYVEKLPVAQSGNEPIFNEKADTMLHLNKELAEQKQKLMEYLTVNHSIDKFPKKLQNPENLEFADFIRELKKKKVNTDDSSIFESLKNYHNNIIKIKARIDKTDREIDKMVYELYGLTEEEIKIVEKACA